MGWLFGHNWEQKSDMVSHILEPGFFNEVDTLIKHAIRGNHFWVLLERSDNKTNARIRYITLFLLQKNEGVYGYKDIDESSQPFYYSCPLSLIRLAEADGCQIGGDEEKTKEWRGKVIGHHQAVAAKKKITKKFGVGTVLRLYGECYELREKLTGRQGWRCFRLSDGVAFRMPAKNLSDAELVT